MGMALGLLFLNSQEWPVIRHVRASFTAYIHISDKFKVIFWNFDLAKALTISYHDKVVWFPQNFDIAHLIIIQINEIFKCT